LQSLLAIGLMQRAILAVRAAVAETIAVTVSNAVCRR
jgi:hypothetical protein